MIAHTTWRDLFYKLAEAHPDCLMLNFTVKVGRAQVSREGGAAQPCGLSGVHTECQERLCLCLGQHRFSVGPAELTLPICADGPQADLTWLPFFRHQAQETPESGRAST